MPKHRSFHFSPTASQCAHCSTATMQGHDNRISLNTFRQIMKTETPLFCVSMRVRGICDTCFIIHEHFRTLSPQYLASRVDKWQNHLHDARRYLNFYQESNRNSRVVYRNPSVRLRFASLSYGFALQLNLLMMAEQTLNEYFAKKKGYNANLLCIVDLHQHGCHYKYINGEG